MWEEGEVDNGEINGFGDELFLLEMVWDLGMQLGSCSEVEVVEEKDGFEDEDGCSGYIG